MRSWRTLGGVLAACVLFACAHPSPSARDAVASAQTASPPKRALPALGDEPGVAVGVHGAVATAEAHASAVGLQILQRGGNAVDAAVAIAFALAVTHPVAGNLGGGGFMIVRSAAGESVAIDYREVAPLGATRDMYLDEQGNPSRKSTVGALAAGIPGTVAGLEMAHTRFGKLRWSEVVAPAIALASDGHAVDDGHAADLLGAVDRMRKAGFEATAKLFTHPDGSALRAGDTWHQPELAATLRLIASQGAKAFYTGALAARMASEVQALGGIWQAQDLASYRAVAREPLRFSYLGHEVITMPPPSAGGIVMRQILFASETLRLRDLPWRSVQATHLYVEAARRAFADRSHWISDPDRTEVPTAQLIDPQYVATRMRNIDAQRATPSSEVSHGDPHARVEPTETTHFSVVDEAGNAVANTYTLNGSFGALVAIPGTGVLLNNEMDDFAASPGRPNLYGLVQGERNAVAPGKRMLSSMTPTVLVKDGALRAVLGSPGGPTITTTVAQLVMALVDHGRSLPEAVRAGRVHHQWLPDQISVEPGTDLGLIHGLQTLGHTVTPYASPIGHAHCIEVDPRTRGYRAVADVGRGDGAAAAY